MFLSGIYAYYFCLLYIVSLVLTLMFNVMDYPAAAVPVTRQTQEDELNIANYSCTDKIHDLIKQVGFTWHFIYCRVMCIIKTVRN
jgi:hypothetical protein